MNNYAIARVFTRIGDLMEIKGDNLYKIRAYRTAAQAMQEMTESLEVLAERGDLKTIPGVGDAIADKTRAIIATGTCDLYERLKKEVPESLVDMLDLPGFGAKKIQTVWQQLGVRSLAELEQAARDHRLRDVPGIGAKSEETLLQTIGSARLRRARVPLYLALPYAEALVRMLRETGAFTRIEIAGSVRRMKDTVGDINLVASAPDPEAALDVFARHAEAREVLERAPAEMCVLTENGLRVDLRLTTGQPFAVLLQRFTGSEEHNEHLRLRAAERSMRLGPDGLSDGESGGVLTVETEEELYARLELPLIPPELREGRGEVEAAAKGRLPRLIEQADIRGVLHAHSIWTDGLVSIARMAEAARKLGYAYHGNTDHSKALAFARGLDETRLRDQMREIDRLNADLGDSFRILKGIECDILPDGTLDLPLPLLEELDLVVASVHSHQRLDQETMTARIVRALESGVVDILGHPTGRRLGHRDPYGLEMERVFAAAAANRVALEINAAPDRLDLHDLHARRARELGILISINTDAHRPENVGLYRYGISQARRAGLEAEDVINTWPLARLLGWLRTREK